MKLNLKKNKNISTSSLKEKMSQISEKFHSSLTKREKRLLGILAVSLLFAAYYNFILKPDLEKISSLEEKVITYKQQYDQIMTDISPDNPIHEEFKILRAKTLMTAAALFPEMKQEKIITELDGMVKDNKIDILNISFTEPSIGNIEVRKENQANTPYILNDLAKQYRGETTPNQSAQENLNGENTQDQAQNRENTIQAEKMEATIQFESNYSNYMNFIKTLEDYDKNIIIKNLSVFSKNGDDKLMGNMTLLFYAIPKLFHEDNDFLSWDYDNPYGKSNPFDPFSGYRANSSMPVDEVKNTQALPVDFFLSANAITSDIPTVVMGKSGDSTAETYVYADNPGFEDVELQIYKVDHSYYYKYKTQRESYPKDYEGNGIEFQPKGSSVYFKIYSYKRNNDNDQNGINLKLVNKTDLELVVDVDGDDAARPRVSIKEKFGNVIIKK